MAEKDFSKVRFTEINLCGYFIRKVSNVEKNSDNIRLLDKPLTLLLSFQSFLSWKGIGKLISWGVFEIIGVEWIEQWTVEGSPFNFF